MSDETPEKSSKPWLYVTGVLVGLLALYFLSTGPVCVMIQRGWLPVSAYEIFAPLEWVVERLGIDGWFDNYVEFWLKLTNTPF